MNIPNTIKYQGMSWEIAESDPITHEANSYGTTHHHRQKIFIEPTETQQKKEAVLIHELMHVIWVSAGLHLRYDEKEANYKGLEEQIVTVMSNGLYAVLKDNDLLK